MADVGGAPSGPVLTPVAAPGRGLSWRVALGLMTAALVAFVGISLVTRPGGGSESQAAVAGPTATPTATPALTPTMSPTAPPVPPVGTPPPRVMISLGPVRACPPWSTPDTPGPVGQARPPELSALAFDRRAGRLVALAGIDERVETWTFDVCANIWSRMRPDKEPPPGTGGLVHDADSDVTIALDGSNRAWVYDLEADTWTKKGSAPATKAAVALRFYDPVSGLIVATADDGDPDTLDLELWSYDVETDTWTPIPQANRLALEPREYAYDASVDRMVAYTDAGARPGGPRTWLFDLRTGTWSGTGAVTPAFSYGWWGAQPAVAYDEAAERIVIAGQGRSVAYDASADRWETLFETPSEDPPGACDTRPECRTGRQMVYDAVNRRLIAYGGRAYTTCTWTAPDDVRVFDMATRAWALIVPPNPVPPPLRDLTASGPSASTGPDRSPWIHAAKVTLHGGPFFTRVPGVADGGPWASTPPAAAASIADGLFLPECQLWTDGTVWWEETTSDPSSRAWIEIGLGGTFLLDTAVVQADVNDVYLLSYRDPKTKAWAPLWSVPLGEVGGMATRPQQGDASVRWSLARPVVTNALRFEATGGDAQYSVSEIAVFGKPAR